MKVAQVALVRNYQLIIRHPGYNVVSDKVSIPNILIDFHHLRSISFACGEMHRDQLL